MPICLSRGLHRAAGHRPCATAAFCGGRRQDWRTLAGALPLPPAGKRPQIRLRERAVPGGSIRPLIQEHAS